jgi:diguanylate cyclase (GGDEF)-like protein/PAS domain S-box-containing protein
VFESVLAQVSDVVVVIDTTGAVRYVNAAAERLLGYRVADWLGRSPFELFHPDDVGPMAEALLICRDKPGVREPMLVRVRHADQSWRMFEIVGNSLFDDTEIAGIVIIARDVTARAAQHVSLARERRRFEIAFEYASIGMALIGLDGTHNRVNRAYQELLQYDATALTTLTITELTHLDELDAIQRDLRHLAARDFRSYARDVRLRRADGTWIWVRLSTSAIHHDDADLDEVLAQVVDITDARALAARLEHDATHDQLTGLASRNLLYASIERALAHATHSDHQVGLLVIDLDGFKPVNDRHGHGVGDALLSAVADRLNQAVRRGDLVARLGGDEFVVMLAGITHLNEATDVAQRIVDDIATPFAIANHRVEITASVGVALSGSTPTDPQSLLHRADRAAYKAKAQGKGTYRAA